VPFLREGPQKSRLSHFEDGRSEASYPSSCGSSERSLRQRHSGFPHGSRRSRSVFLFFEVFHLPLLHGFRLVIDFSYEEEIHMLFAQRLEKRAEDFYPFIWTADLRQCESVSSSQRFFRFSSFRENLRRSRAGWWDWSSLLLIRKHIFCNNFRV